MTGSCLALVWPRNPNSLPVKTRLHIFPLAVQKRNNALLIRLLPPSKTPPWASGNIVIREPTGVSQSLAQVKKNVTSSSRPEVGWQPSFKLYDKPLPATTNVRTWSQGQGGWVAESLVHSLLLLEDISCFLEAIEESMTRRLQWHIIKIALYFLFISFACVFPFLLHM